MSLLVKTLNKLDSLIYYAFKYYWYRLIFKKVGRKTRILKPLRIDGGGNINLGSGVVIGKLTWLAAQPVNLGQKSNLSIGDGSRIGNFNHIYATSEIVIGENVLTADKVYISDNQHSFDLVDIPIWKQKIKQLKAVSIGEGTWIGENACIIGASIGRYCVVGANSIVKSNIPDYCVAVGSPAKIVKRYCFERKKWMKVNEIGEFK